MFGKIIKTISNFLVKNGGKAEESEVYSYALINLMNKFVINTILLLLSIKMNLFFSMLIWILVFNSLRMNLGGAHAKTPMRCELYSVIIGLISVDLGKKIGIWFNNRRFFIIGCVVACIWIAYRKAPILNCRHPISERLKKKAKKKSMWITGILGILAYMMIPDFPVYGTVITGMVGAYALLFVKNK